MSNTTTKILIVEDNPLIAADLEATVEDMGYWVVGPALTLEDGLELATEDEIDFALLDYDLGDGNDSAPIAEMLTSRGLKFAFVTGTDPAVVRAAFSKAVVLSKPVDEDALERVMPA